ncbi:MAG: hypothetical protein IKP31_02360 [Lachnospiraceae bacterium]|nr:hypothetical protein [Lachnospiraceae bacterium]
METVTDMNVLYDAFRASMKSSAWKEEPQRFETDFLSELVALHNELSDRTYQTLPGTEFTQHERGKIRHIHGNRMRDRVVRHALCDKVLAPTLHPYMIYNNGASQEGKGIDFSRALFERDLHNYWLEHRTNEGYVCFVDFSKFYDNIHHDKIKDTICPMLDDQAAWLLSSIVDTFAIDVSYMTDEEYATCLEDKFDSIRYYNTATDKMKTGEKLMYKSVNIGDQTSQNIGIYFPSRIDNYVTIVRGFKRYGRYMDDMYMIHRDKEYIEETLHGVYKEAAELGLFINEKKTRICKLSDTFIYLQVKYFVTDTGKVVKRINPKSVTRQRRKLKAYKRMLDKGIMTYDSIMQEYKSWMGRYTRIMSKAQIKNMKALYNQLFKEDVRWKN